MLLKTKIKYRIHDNADQILNEAEKCERSIHKLRELLIEESNNFLVSELAFQLNEAIQGIYGYIDERRDDEEWLRKFSPKRDTKLNETMDKTVVSLANARFDPQAA